MLPSEGVNTRFYPITHLIDLEVDKLVNENPIGIPLGLRMQVDRMLSVLEEHEALEANAWITLLVFAAFALQSHPLDVSVVVFDAGLQLWQFFLNIEANMILAHLLAQFVNVEDSNLLKPFISLVLHFDCIRRLLMCKLMHNKLIRLLHPLIRDDKLYFLYELIKVSILDKFHEDWLLSS